MAVLSYKCPNCSGPLKFSANKQLFDCEYCRSEFSKPELDKIFSSQDPSKEKVDAKGAAQTDSRTQNDAEFDKNTVEYSCPSCGANIITSETTAASTCYYCHNPVMLSKQLSDKFRPDKIIPFSISKENAVEKFKAFCGKKRFLPKDFYSEDQIKNMRGVYYPYYLVEAKANGYLTAEGKNVKTWRQGDTEYTEITFYDVVREGEVTVDGISLCALKNTDHNMLKYVCPYDESKVTDFTMPYLSGFEAERRDMGREELKSEAYSIVGSTAKSMLHNTVTGYNSVNVTHSDSKVVFDKWEYALFPVWVMTYHFGGKSYIYAMNGQTGKLYGTLPVSKKKLLTLFGIVSGSVFALIMTLLLSGGML